MLRRRFLLLLLPLPAAHALPGAAPADAAVWAALRRGGHVVLIRHALTEPGIGDPPGFRPGVCATQRNLSQQGRADARRIGAAFRRRAIPVDEVWSSHWCRCIDTAQLAFGRVKPVSMLDSMFNDPARSADSKAAELDATLARHPRRGNLILVTHAQNIQRHTGVAVAAGEIVVALPDARGKLALVGRIETPS